MVKVLGDEQKFVLKLLSSFFNEEEKVNGGDFKNLSALSWRLIFDETRAHGVSLMLYDRISSIKKAIPDDVFLSIKNVVALGVKNNLKVSLGQSKILSLLKENGFDCLIIKGSSSASYYNKPELRLLGDVDILIKEKDVRPICRLLSDYGYEKGRSDHPNHVCFFKDDVTFELHFEIAGIPYGKTGEFIRNFLQENAFVDATVKNDGIADFNAPSDFIHGIILILHTCHHLLGEGVGLRHLLDFASYLKKTADQPFWQERLLPFLKEVGLLTFTNSIIKTVTKYFSIEKPSWFMGEKDGIEDQIILDVLSAGNFGAKDELRACSGMLISEHGKDGTGHGAVYNLSHSLHKAVLRIPAVKKCVILYPFVYFYKAIKFLFLSLIGRRPSLIKMVPEAKNRKQIYEKLKVFQTENKEK